MHNYTRRLFKPLFTLTIITITLLIVFSVFYALFPARYIDIIDKYCSEYDVNSHLVLALIKAESNFSQNAVSRADAKGLMQLTESTFLHCISLMGIKDEDVSIENPKDNIRIGVWYLSSLIKKYSGNIQNAVAAYNAGPSSVDKWLSDPSLSSDGKTLDVIPFGETARHVKKISRYKVIYNFLY